MRTLGRRGVRAMAAIALAVLAPTAARAWGDASHKIVCDIATRLLSPDEQREVKALMRAFRRPDGQRYAHLSTACTFADTARAKARAYEGTGDERLEPWARFAELDRWHFLNVPRSARHVPAAGCRDCVLEAIEHHLARLSDRSLPSSARGEALALLGHWVGDVHQPLHVGYADDRGGTEIDRITGVYGGADDLHQVWDSGILFRALGSRDWRAYARELHASIEPAQRESWERSDAREWADESYAIATEAEARYCRWDGGQCLSLGRKRHLGPSYQTRFQPVVEVRLKQSGVRLARLISQALSGTPRRLTK